MSRILVLTCRGAERCQASLQSVQKARMATKPTAQRMTCGTKPSVETSTVTACNDMACVYNICIYVYVL